MIQVRAHLNEKNSCLSYFVLLSRLYRSTIGVARALSDIIYLHYYELYPGTKGPTLV
jgi:hypothetical protein